MSDLHRSGVRIAPVLLRAAIAASLLLPGVLHAGDSTDVARGADASASAELRHEYSEQPDYNPFYFVSDESKAFGEAIKAGDAEQVAALGQPWLQHCPVDALGHFHVAMALTSLGQRRDAFRHLYFFYGLVQSILESGTGASRESAFKVISIPEEYAVLNVLDAKLLGQTLAEPYDVMTVKMDGEETALYFDISIPLAAQRRVWALPSGQQPDEEDLR